MLERFTPSSIEVIQQSQKESRRLGHNFVGTAQLLAGLAAVEQGKAAQILAERGVTLHPIQAAIEARSGRGEGATVVEMPFTPAAKRALKRSLSLSQSLGSQIIDTEHLLLGVLTPEQGNSVRQILTDLAVDPDQLRKELLIEVSQDLAHRLRQSPQVTDPSATRLYVALFEATSLAQTHLITGSEARFQLPTGLDILSTDVSLIPYPHGPHPIPVMVALACQDLDLHGAVEAKLRLFLQVGTQVGCLLDPSARTVKILRPNSVKLLKGRDRLRLPEILPHWELPIRDLWQERDRSEIRAQKDHSDP